MDKRRVGERRITLAIRSLLATQPFFGSLVLRLPVVRSDDVDKMASDGANLFVDTEWAAGAQAADMQQIIADIVMGCALKHHTRRGERNYCTWQRAHAKVVLPILRDAGLTDEPGGLDMSIEAAYDLLHQEEDDGPGSSERPQGGFSGDGAGEMMDSPAGDDGGGEGDTRQDSLRREEQKWDQAAQQAVQIAKSQGRTPGAASALIEAQHNRTIDWAAMLREFMTASAKADFSWSEINRRFAWQGLHLPSLRSIAVGPVAFLIDSSGSMNNPVLSLVWSEVRAAAADCRPEGVVVIQCDTDVRSVSHYDVDDMPLEIDAVGRGGTRFSPALAAAAELETPPNCVIYLTDGECDDFGEDPGLPVIWTLEPDGKRDFKPPFGEVIRMGETVTPASRA